MSNAKTYKLELTYEQLMCVDRALENRLDTMDDAFIRTGNDYFSVQAAISEKLLELITSMVGETA